MHLLRIKTLLLCMATASVLAAGGCAGFSNDRVVKGPKFEDMTAAQHRQAAALERALARDEAAKARDQLGPGTPGEGWESPVYSDHWGLWDAYWDPMEPEYYTIDPRPHVGGEGHADSAARHRERAERHDQAAQQLEEMARARTQRRTY